MILHTLGDYYIAPNKTQKMKIKEKWKQNSFGMVTLNIELQKQGLFLNPIVLTPVTKDIEIYVYNASQDTIHVEQRKWCARVLEVMR